MVVENDSKWLLTKTKVQNVYEILYLNYTIYYCLLLITEGINIVSSKIAHHYHFNCIAIIFKRTEEERFPLVEDYSIAFCLKQVFLGCEENVFSKKCLSIFMLCKNDYYKLLVIILSNQLN